LPTRRQRGAAIAVEVITGTMRAFEDLHHRAVVFTDPELACGGPHGVRGEPEGVNVEVAKFPSVGVRGAALTRFDRTDECTKLVIDPESERILGVRDRGFRCRRAYR